MAGRERISETPSGVRPAERKRGFGRIPLETEICWFILANLLDFIVTYRMIAHGNAAGVRFYESNPVALFFLNHWGVKGLLGLKLGVVVFVCLVAQIAWRHKPELARFLLIAGTAAVAAIVLYSVRMFFHTQ